MKPYLDQMYQDVLENMAYFIGHKMEQLKEAKTEF